MAQGLTEETYNLAAAQQSRDNPAIGQILSHSITVDPYLFQETETSYAVVTVTYTATTNTAGTGIYAYTSTWDGNAIDCKWNIETVNTGLSTNVVYPFHGVFCRIENAALATGSHTLAFSRATTSGTPSTISHETISYRLDRTDLVEDGVRENLTQHRNGSLEVNNMSFNTIGFDGYLFVLLFLGIFLWGGYTRQLLVSLAGAIGVLVTFTGGVPFSGTYPLLLALLAAAALAIRQSWQAMGSERNQAEKET